MKTIVIDDDPTGSQTVHDCPLLLSWDKKTLLEGLEHSSLLFILANTRSLPPNRAKDRIRKICKSLSEVFNEKGLSDSDISIVSRGDSTLRGHGFLEPETINEELGPFDATFHIPAFFEGNRITINGTHFANGIPVNRTIFAKDKIFGYSNSFLPSWIEEKSNGLVKANNVVSISIDKLDKARESKIEMNNLIEFLSSLTFNQTVIVDAKTSIDLDVFCSALNALNGKKRFLFRSAASFINSLTNIKSQTSDINEISCFKGEVDDFSYKSGMVIVGSHVSLADNQLAVLLRSEDCIGIELPVAKFLKILEGSLDRNLLLDFESILVDKIEGILNKKKTPVFYTSRGELFFESNLSRISFGISLAEFMAVISSKFIDRLSYIISKGGITTNTLLKKGLKADFVNLKGQIMPGLSLVSLPKNSTGFPCDLLTFPGNLGDNDTLLKSWEIMQSYSDYQNKIRIF